VSDDADALRVVVVGIGLGEAIAKLFEAEDPAKIAVGGSALAGSPTWEGVEAFEVVPLPSSPSPLYPQA